MAKLNVSIKRCTRCFKLAAWNCGRSNCPISGYRPVEKDDDKPQHQRSQRQVKSPANRSNQVKRISELAVLWIQENQSWFENFRTPLAFQRHVNSLRSARFERLNHLSYQDACLALRTAAQQGLIAKIGTTQERGRLYQYQPPDTSDPIA